VQKRLVLPVCLPQRVDMSRTSANLPLEPTLQPQLVLTLQQHQQH
jgi:hypothetical protein